MSEYHEGFKLRAEKFVGYEDDYDLDTSKSAEAHLMMEVLEVTGFGRRLFDEDKPKVLDFGFDFKDHAAYFFVEWELKN